MLNMKCPYCDSSETLNRGISKDSQYPHLCSKCKKVMWVEPSILSKKNIGVKTVRTSAQFKKEVAESSEDKKDVVKMVKYIIGSAKKEKELGWIYNSVAFKWESKDEK